jgi:hypothetical protein
MSDLKINIAKKEEKEYIITLIQATRNIECYIIKQFVNWTDDEIRNYGINKFKRENCMILLILWKISWINRFYTRDI